MARRIVLTMLALVSVLLITAVAPLGLIAAGREQDSFRVATVMSAMSRRIEFVPQSMAATRECFMPSN